MEDGYIEDVYKTALSLVPKEILSKMHNQCGEYEGEFEEKLMEIIEKEIASRK